MCERITISDIASAVCVSPSHLHAIFRNTLGVSPIEYKLRLPDRRGAAPAYCAPGSHRRRDIRPARFRVRHILPQSLQEPDGNVPDRVQKNTHHNVKNDRRILPRRSSLLLFGSRHQLDHNGFLSVESVLSLFEYFLRVSLEDVGGDLLAAVSGQAVLNHRVRSRLRP